MGEETNIIARIDQKYQDPMMQDESQ